MKRMFALLLALCLFLSALPAFAQENTAAQENAFVTEWDLTQIYADQAAFDADYATLEAAIPRYEALRGTLSTPEGMLNYQTLNNEFDLMINRLGTYASFKITLNATDINAKRLMARVNALEAKMRQAVSFMESEIAAMTPAERAALVASPLLADYAYALRSIADEKTVYLSEETNRALAILNDALYTTDSVYTTLLYADLPYPVYTLPDGTVLTLNPTNFTNQVLAGTPRDTLLEMSRLRALRYKPFENTFAACLDAHVRTLWDYATLNRYDSTLAFALHGADVDPRVYPMLVQAAHDGAPELQRYYRVMKRALGLENTDMYTFDTMLPATDYRPEKTFAQSAADVLDALSIFGEEYVSAVRAILTSGHIDAFPRENKNTGAYSSAVDDRLLPYITLNYISAADANVIAHELGHAMYSRISAENQPTQYINAGIFTQEVASTSNEIIFFRTMYDKAQSDDERLYYLQKQIDMFAGTFFTQVQYAEFEDFCYKTVENGGVLLASSLNDEMARLRALYTGDTIKQLNGSESGWCSIPHFYYSYYVFNYASSLCYASVLASRIYDGAEGAKERYLDFLKLGASVSPVAALTAAGVDPLDKATYDAAMDYFTGLLDKYEALIAR